MASDTLSFFALYAVAFTVAFGVAYAATLVLRPLAKQWGLLDHPDHRKLHQSATPLVGGIVIFAGFMTACMLYVPLDVELLYFLFAATIVLGTGIGDDLGKLAIKSRLLLQSVAALVLIFAGDVSIDSLGNLFGFGEVRLGWVAVPFTVVAVVGVINAFNMTDGVDGLAGCLTLVALLALMLLIGDAARSELLLIACLCAAILAFLTCNLSSNGNRKIFLGDAGSMLLGFAVAWLLVKFSQGENRYFSPAVALWMIALPLYDMGTVMAQRIRSGKSPFTAGRDHVHHKLIDDGRLTVKQSLVVLALLAVLLSSQGLLAEFAGFAEHVMFYAFIVLLVVYGLSAQRFPLRLSRLLYHRQLRWRRIKKRGQRARPPVSV